MIAGESEQRCDTHRSFFDAWMLLTYALMRFLNLPLPTARYPIQAAPVLLPALFIAPLGEELGWSGYVIDPKQHRWNTLEASIVLGLVWAAWHIVPLTQADRSLGWIAWWSLATVASRVLIVWLYNTTVRSVFAASLFHGISNLSWLLFPNYGSHYDPRISAPIIALAAAIVAIVWGPRYESP